MEIFDEKGIRETVRHNIDNMKVDGLYVIGNGLFQTLKELLKCQGVNAGYCKEPLERPELIFLVSF